MKLIELLHDITQQGFRIEFSDDFEGMITITVYEDSGPNYKGGYIRHEHLGFPQCERSRLQSDIESSLERLLVEIKLGQIQRDGLADPQ